MFGFRAAGNVPRTVEALGKPAAGNARATAGPIVKDTGARRDVGQVANLSTGLLGLLRLRRVTRFRRLGLFFFLRSRMTDGLQRAEQYMRVPAL